MAGDDVIGAVARGIYAPVLAVTPAVDGKKLFFDSLPADARLFMKEQAREALVRLRDNVTDGMVAAGVSVLAVADQVAHGPLDDLAKDVFITMLDRAMGLN